MEKVNKINKQIICEIYLGESQKHLKHIVIMEKSIGEYNIHIKFYIFIYGEKNIFEYRGVTYDGLKTMTDIEMKNMENDVLNSSFLEVKQIIHNLSEKYYIFNVPNEITLNIVNENEITNFYLLYKDIDEIKKGLIDISQTTECNSLKQRIKFLIKHRP